MIINHNIAALNTYNKFGAANKAQSGSMEKLSSGLRINKAGDDAAGLAISEKMRGQIRGLDMAGKNAQDGISLIQTAEGALSETHSILQRMRELSVQSSNDTNTVTDRSEIQKEIDQLTSEIDRIGNTTEFNTKKLLNGGASVGVSKAGVSAALVSNFDGTGETKAGATVTTTAITAATADTITGAGAGLAASATFTASSQMTINGTSFSFTTADTVQSALDAINNAGIGATASLNGTNDLVLTSTTVGSASDLQITGLAGDFAATGALDVSGAITQGADASVTIAGVSTTASGNTITIQSGNAKGLSFDVSGDGTAVTLTVDSNNGVNLQIGANEGQTMYASISDMRAIALGVDNIDVKSASTSSDAITTIQSAIEKVSAERSKLGAYQNRLDHTINNLGTSAENLTAAESRIRDVDMAKEMMNQTKNSILSQAAQAMLAQANQQPQQVLQLLQ